VSAGRGAPFRVNSTDAPACDDLPRFPVWRYASRFALAQLRVRLIFENMLKNRKRLGAVVLLGAAGIIYLASTAGAPPGDVSVERTYSASTPAAVIPKSEVADTECAGWNECTESETQGEAALHAAAFAPAVPRADQPRADQPRADQPRAEERQVEKTVASAPVARAETKGAAQPPSQKAKREFVAVAPKPPPENLGEKRAAGATDGLTQMLNEEPAPPEPQPTARVVVAPQTVRAPETALVVGRFQNKAGSDYELQRVTCLLDGARVYSGPSAGLVELFRRGLSPGAHQVSIIAEYRGRSSGVFSYTDGFKFTLQGSQRFNVAVGQPAQLVATAYERGGPTEPHATRLALAITAR
jgi:hypothetical protein